MAILPLFRQNWLEQSCDNCDMQRGKE